MSLKSDFEGVWGYMRNIKVCPIKICLSPPYHMSFFFNQQNGSFPSPISRGRRLVGAIILPSNSYNMSKLVIALWHLNGRVINIGLSDRQNLTYSNVAFSVLLRRTLKTCPWLSFRIQEIEKKVHFMFARTVPS